MATSTKSNNTESVDPTSNKQPYMSEYDKNVELRLQALETQSHTPCSNSNSNGIDLSKLSALEAKVDDLVERLSRKLSF